MDISVTNLPNPYNTVVRVIRDMNLPLNLEKGPWIAGGAVRRILEGNSDFGNGDIDLFLGEGQSPLYIESIFNSPCALGKGIKNHTGQRGVINYRMKVNDKTFNFQIVTIRGYKDLEDLFCDFDFTVCAFATDGYKLASTPQAMYDLRNRMLVPIEDSKRRLRPSRLAKYIRHGFAPAPGTLTKVLRLDEPNAENITNTLYVSTDHEDNYVH